MKPPLRNLFLMLSLALAGLNAFAQATNANPAPFTNGIFFESVTGKSNGTVTIAVKIKGFSGYRAIQGNIDFGTAVVDTILSVTPGAVLTADNTIDGSTAKLANNIFTFSYDKSNGDLVLPDSSTLFTITLQLNTIASPDDNSCSTPTVNPARTKLLYGKFVNGSPVTFAPDKKFGDICVRMQTITIGDLSVACPGSTGGYYVPFTPAGFGPGDVFTLYYDSTNTTPVATAVYSAGDNFFYFNSAIPIRANRSFIAVSADGTIGDTAAVPFTDLDNKPYDSQIALDGTPQLPGTYTTCGTSDSKFAVSGNGADFAYQYRDSLGSSGSNTSATGNFTVPTSGNKNTFSVSIITKNADGCANTSPYTYYIHSDIAAPSLDLTGNSNSNVYVHFSGTEKMSFDPRTMVSSVSDNCSEPQNITVKVLSADNTEYTTAADFAPGDHQLKFIVSDERGNTDTLRTTLYVVKDPVFTFKQNGSVSSYGISDAQLEIAAFASGDNTSYDFKEIKAEISTTGFADLSAFTFEKLGNYTGTVSLTYLSPGKAQLTMSNVSGFRANTPFLRIKTKSFVASDENDVDTGYTAVSKVSITRFIDGRDTVYNQSGDTVYNTINGLGVISGNFKTALFGSNHTKATDLTCNGCVNTGSISNVAHLNQSGNNNTYRFRVIPGSEISLVVSDLSGDNAMTGTNDAIITRQFILGTYDFTPFQVVAANVDNFNDINTLDVLQIRENLLLARPKFINSYGEASAYDFKVNIGNGTYANVVDLEIGQEAVVLDFSVFTLGSVTNYFADITVPKGKVGFGIGSVAANHSGMVEVPVLAGAFDQVAGYQFTLGWDPAALEYAGYSAVKHNPLTETSLTAEGKLMVSWLEGTAKNSSCKEGDTLFMVQFNVLGTVGSRASIDFVDHYTPVAAYDQDIALKQIVTSGGEVSITTGIKDLGNGYGISSAVPNPFRSTTTIGFTLPQQQDVTFTVYNALGQVAAQTLNFQAGVNNWTLPYSDNLAPGVYTIIISGQGINESVKVVKQ
ncbi:MAG: T9SS type A sorting domain-containing protein [Bacteroidota bacterium]